MRDGFVYVAVAPHMCQMRRCNQDDCRSTHDLLYVSRALLTTTRKFKEGGCKVGGRCDSWASHFIYELVLFLDDSNFGLQALGEQTFSRLIPILVKPFQFRKFVAWCESGDSVSKSGRHRPISCFGQPTIVFSTHDNVCVCHCRFHSREFKYTDCMTTEALVSAKKDKKTYST